jgi:hypothetical protein
LVLFGTEAMASGGLLKRKTDGQPDGYYYNAGGLDAARYLTLYGGSEFSVDAVICAVRKQDLNSGQPPLGTLLVELRRADPNAPGYADLAPGGLVATADANSALVCSTTGAPTTVTFGSGAGAPHPAADVFVSAAQPANGAGNLDFCGILLDTSSAFNGASRQQSYAPGGFRSSLGFNHFLEAIVFDPRLQDLSLRTSGSARYPGDRGISILFARRACDVATAGCVEARDGSGRTDDLLTTNIVIDNNTPSLVLRNLEVVVDRSVFDPKLAPKDVLVFLRPVGGGPKYSNPAVLPPGRTILSLQLPVALKTKLLAPLPVDVPVIARLTAVGDPSILYDVETSVLRLSPEVGFLDSGDIGAAGFFAPRFPVLTGDALEVRFDAVDLPKPGNTWIIEGATVIGGEVGASGLPGLADVTLRREDPVLADTPDLSPQGLFRRSGPLPMGTAPFTLEVNFTNFVVTPVHPALADPLWLSALLNPGDSATTVAGVSGSLVAGASSVAFSNEIPRTASPATDWMMRLDFEQTPSVRRSRGSGPGGRPAVTEPREALRFIPLGGNGERLDR